MRAQEEREAEQRTLTAIGMMSALFVVFGAVFLVMSIQMDRDIEAWWVGFMILGSWGFMVRGALKSLQNRIEALETRDNQANE